MKKKYIKSEFKRVEAIEQILCVGCRDHDPYCHECRTFFKEGDFFYCVYDFHLCSECLEDTEE